MVVAVSNDAANNASDNGHGVNHAVQGVKDAIAITPVSEEQSKKLFRWNLVLGLIHLATGIVILIITDRDAVIPVYSFFSDSDTRGQAGADWLVAPKLHGDFAVGLWSGISLLLSSLDHLLVATVFRKKYEYYLARKRNPFRWIEYAFSASIMHVMIAQLSGMFSVHLLYAVFGLTMVTMIFGNEQEIANAQAVLMRNNIRDQTNSGVSVPSSTLTFRPFWCGCIPHLYGWSLILCFFFQGVSKGEAPGFVWAIIFILFFLDATFPVNQYLQQRGIGKWSDYVFGEIWFCILSLVAKQLLAWLNFGGTQSL